jgi:hypothetical protein
VVVIDHESRHEVFVFARSATRVMERHADYLVADANCPIPGTVFGGENIALVCCRELLAV